MRRSRKLAFICQTFGLGGAEVFARDLLWALKEKEHFTVVVWTTFPLFQQMLREVGIISRRLPVEIDIIGNWKGLVKASMLWPVALAQYLYVVMSLDADVILLTGFFEKLVVTPLARLKRMEVVWIEYAPLTAIEKKHFGIPLWLYLQIAPMANRIIVPTAHTSRWFERRTKLIGRVQIIPCGRYKLPASTIKKNVNVTNDAHSPRIVCVSRIEAGKGHDLLVRALSMLVRKYPMLMLLFAGEGSQLEDIRRLVDEKNLVNNVQFLGRVPDVFEVIQDADVAVFPSVWEMEGFGLVTIEAMACAKPVVAFSTGPTLEILSHEKNGLLVPTGDWRALASAIDRLLSDPDFAAKLGKQACLTYEKQYRLENLVKKYAEVFLGNYTK